MINEKKQELLHYGVKRRSGRYPWGSGEDPYQHEAYGFIAKLDSYREKGLSNTEIAKELGMSRKQLENEIMLANKAIRQSRINQVKTMKEDGKTNTEIAQRLGISEASVRNYLNPKSSVIEQQMDNLVNVLKDQVKNKEYLDVGKGTEYQLSIQQQMGISKNKLDAAIQQLEKEGYYMHKIYVRDLYDSNKYTTVQVLTKEKDANVVYQNMDKVRAVTDWTEDGGISWNNVKEPLSVDWDRIAIRYGDKGGSDKDGTIELRRGVKDLDMGNAHYAQARIKVGDTHYLKGMAFYSDDIPKGKDIVFNTNKKSGTPKEDVLKALKDDPDNPFGATISRQIIDPKTKKVTSAINIVNQEGDWAEWGHTLSSQFLSKQPLKLVKDRLDATYDSLDQDYQSISSVKNPVIKKYLLEKFSESCDKDARLLKAKGVAGEMAEVILPVTSMKPTEVYAPNYKNGTKVVLVRYPHGGTFELPELTVNNKQKEAEGMIGKAIDAIGIHPSVASKLSGADFDGDTVYVLPNNNKRMKIKTSSSLEGLKNFDPNVYHVDGPKTISPTMKQKQMGIVSNLITDMTIHNAPTSDIVRAVRHSMVVIDSEKHNLDWKQSKIDNGIEALHKKYQGKAQGGASTLISKSKQVEYVDKKGEILKARTVKEVSKNGRTYSRTAYFRSNGKEVRNPIKRFKMDAVDDASKLSSGTAVEGQYVNYINKVKAIKNKAIKDAVSLELPSKDKEAANKYSVEVKSLEQKLYRCLANSPLERQVQIQAVNQYYKKRTPGMDEDAHKKLARQVTSGARAKIGTSSENHSIHLSNKEWEAIQNNALSPTKIRQILKFVPMEELRQLATPSQRVSIPSAKIVRAQAMLNSGRTWSEISEALGIPVSTLRYELLDA